MSDARPWEEEGYERRFRRWDVSGARFITFSCYNRLPLLRNPAIMNLFAAQLASARQRHGIKLYAWVIMPEHVHLVINPCDVRWSTVAQYLKTNVAKRVLDRWRALGPAAHPVLQAITTDGSQRFWQHGGGFDRNVRDGAELTKAIRYVHRNPVKRELVDKPESWAWSSVRWWMGKRTDEVECDLPSGEAEWWSAWKNFV